MWVPSIVELLGRLFFFKAKLKNIVSFLMYKTFLDQFWYVLHSKKKIWYVLCFWYMFFLLKNSGNFINRAIVHSKVYNTPPVSSFSFFFFHKVPKIKPIDKLEQCHHHQLLRDYTTTKTFRRTNATAIATVRFGWSFRTWVVLVIFLLLDNLNWFWIYRVNCRVIVVFRVKCIVGL